MAPPLRRADAVVLRSRRRRKTRPRAGAGLKLPTAVFAVGFCAAFLLTAESPRRPFDLAFAFGFGVLGGMAAFAVPWIRFRHTAVAVNQVAP